MSRTSRKSSRGSSPPTSVESGGSNKRKSDRVDSTNDNSMQTPLLNLGRLTRGILVKRPSATIKSPYVADVALCSRRGTNESASTVLAHAPALHVGGMCIEGSELYMSKRDGNGKTSHSIELVRGAPLNTSSEVERVIIHSRIERVTHLQALQ